MDRLAQLKGEWSASFVARADGRERAGILGIALFGFLAFQGHAGAKFGLLWLLVATLPCWREFFSYVRRDPLFHVAWVLVLYMAIRGWFAAQEMPDTAWRQLEAVIDLGVVGLSAAVLSWWLRGDPRRVAVLALVAIAGLCIETVVDDLRIVDVADVLKGAHRTLLGSANARGLIAAMGLLVLVAILPTALRAARRKSRVVMIVTIVAATSAAMLLGLVQLITQSRAVIGLLSLLAPLVVLVQVLRSPRDRKRMKSTLATGAILVAILGSVLALVGPRLVEKMDRELEMVMPYLGTEDLSEMPPSSLGWRVQLTELGLRIGADRPWLGWGTGTSAVEDLARQYDGSHLVRWKHLHNALLEVWVRLGFIGHILYSLMVIVVLRSLAVGARTGRAPPETTVSVTAVTLLLAGYSLVEFRMLAWDFNSAMIMLAATAHTFGPNQQHADPERNWRVNEGSGGETI